MMITVYATKRSLWRLCDEYIKTPLMHNTTFGKTYRCPSYHLEWHGSDGEHHRALLMAVAGRPILTIDGNQHWLTTEELAARGMTRVRA